MKKLFLSLIAISFYTTQLPAAMSLEDMHDTDTAAMLATMDANPEIQSARENILHLEYALTFPEMLSQIFLNPVPHLSPKHLMPTDIAHIIGSYTSPYYHVAYITPQEKQLPEIFLGALRNHLHNLETTMQKNHEKLKAHLNSLMCSTSIISSCFKQTK